ncbi:MAG: histidine triad nucleotide-binding protein [Planctomycetota bacterium]|nr:MAG: histidine triad nucleotide-binding protein [Planctomycetota bacterium]
MNDDCIFCKIAAGDIPADKVYEDEEILAFKDVNPVAPVHVLFVPKDHIAGVNDLNERTAAIVGKIFLAAQKVAAELGVADSGYRIIANTNRDAGQEVFHIHLHLLGGRRMGAMG